MLKTYLQATLLLLGGFNLCFAQQAPANDDRISHYLGLQVNPLLEQIISFGSSPAIDNPFLLKYSLRFNPSQTALMFGVGYQYNQDETRNGLKSDNSQLDFRAGFAKKIAIGKKLEVGLGGDLVVKARNTQTVNVQSINFGSGIDSTITTSKSTNIGYGIGPQLTLSYFITPRLLVGTEATYYFIRSTEKLNVQTVNYQDNQFTEPIVTINTEDDENRSMDFQLQLPVALFLIIVF